MVWVWNGLLFVVVFLSDFLLKERGVKEGPISATGTSIIVDTGGEAKGLEILCFPGS